MTHPITGGYHCGEVRYRINVEPAMQQCCYCSDCTKIGGTDGYAGVVSIAGANFDNPALFKPVRHVLTKSAPPWVRYSDSLEVSQKPH